MHASYLVQLAAIAARQHNSLLDQNLGPDHWGAEHFWVISRARINELSRLLRLCSLHRINDSTFNPDHFWRASEPILEEVFLGEIYTRLWCATLTAIDEVRQPGELEPIARSIHIANLEVRRRALRLLLFAKGVPGINATTSNLLRRNCEVWTDRLLEYVSLATVSQQFCFDRTRMLTATRSHSSNRQQDWENLTFLTGLGLAMASRADAKPICPELNSELATHVLGCLPQQAFDVCGVPRASWRIDAFQTDMASLSILEDLCDEPERSRIDLLGELKDRRN